MHKVHFDKVVELLLVVYRLVTFLQMHLYIYYVPPLWVCHCLALD